MANKKKRKKTPPSQGQARPKKAPPKPKPEPVAAAVAAEVPKAKAPKSQPKGRATGSAAPARPSKARRGSATTQWVVLGVAAAAIIGVVVFLSVRQTLDPGGTGETAAAAWDLPALDEDLDADGRVTLAEFEGTPTVVNFFASWCTACDAELPGFRNAATRLDGEVDFVFVNSNETGDWRPMAERNAILDFPLVKDIAGTNRNGLYRNFGGTGGMPMTAFYDAEGNLVDSVLLPLTEDQLNARLAQYGFV